MNDTTGSHRPWSSKPWRLAAWLAAGAILLVPVTVQVVFGNFGWSLGDFVVLALMLLGSCALFSLAVRRAPNFSYLAGVGFALAAGFGLVFVNGAVGLVGDEGEAANLLFGLVIMIAILGAVFARGRPKLLARAMFLAALAQVAAGVMVMSWVGLRTGGEGLFAEVGGLGMFTLLWGVSGWFFRRSAR